MQSSEIKEYLSKAGIRKVTALDTALIELFGPEEGERHIEQLTALFDLSEERLFRGERNAACLHRQEELVDYLNQSLEMSLLASSFYDRVFFRRALAYLTEHERFIGGEIFDVGCGNGILTCFLALCRPDSFVTGLELSQNAVRTAKELAQKLQVKNIAFTYAETPRQKQCATLFSCRTAHENATWKALFEEPEISAVPIAEYAVRHEAYADRLSALTAQGGYLVSIERYEDDNAYAGLRTALEHAGFCPVRGTHTQFSCKDGDKTGTFQAMVFQKKAF